MKKYFYAIIKLFLWLVFPFLFYLIFIDKSIYNYYYYILIILYIVFWVFPIIFYKRSKKEIIKRLLLINIVLYVVFIFLANITSEKLYIDNRSEELDIQRILNYKKNKDVLLKMNKIEVNDIENFNSMYNDKISKNKCHYISIVNNWKWYIFVLKLFSENYIKKLWTNYYIDKYPADYKITAEEIAKIQEIINKDCLK